MAKTYQGPAVVVGDGVEFQVDVDLRVEFGFVESVDDRGAVVREPGLKHWLGIVRADVTNDFARVAFGGQTVRLRMPDGREGTFYPGGSAVDAGLLDVTGTGPAPFWDEADEPTA